jgi:hypothetical protein
MGKYLMGGEHYGDIGVHGNKVLKWISKRHEERLLTLFTSSLHSRVTYSFEHGNETSASMRG